MPPSRRAVLVTEVRPELRLNSSVIKNIKSTRYTTKSNPLIGNQYIDDQCAWFTQVNRMLLRQFSASADVDARII